MIKFFKGQKKKAYL